MSLWALLFFLLATALFLVAVVVRPAWNILIGLGLASLTVGVICLYLVHSAVVS